jgi:hypothetical protein
MLVRRLPVLAASLVAMMGLAVPMSPSASASIPGPPKCNGTNQVKWNSNGTMKETWIFVYSYTRARATYYEYAYSKEYGNVRATGWGTCVRGVG